MGAKVACFDFVKPSTQDTEWGLGGTCVNVGCIPKKLMHHASLLHDEMKDAKRYGWSVNLLQVKNNWERLQEAVGEHIQSLNFGYKNQLLERNVTYLNRYASFVDNHTVKGVDRRGNEALYTAKYIVVAAGGRPMLPDTPGVKEYAITSDDIFWKEENPGKTLVVGASYVALECAGFLEGLGCDVSVMVRSILLRGFDQQIAEMIGTYMEKRNEDGQIEGVKFIRPAEPSRIEKLEDDKLQVFWQHEGTEHSDIFDTVLYATGRAPAIDDLGLEIVGIKRDRVGKIVVNEADQTSVPNIFAIGDVASGRLELTPSAIQAGKLLAKRLFGNSTVLMDYHLIPTTVFTPIEYGACGLGEEDAIAKYGEENIEIYHSYFKPLEYFIPERPDNQCYCKLICHIPENFKVVGFHYLGPHAAEITQGYALAIKMGATKDDFDDVVGIHPSSAEEFTTLDITKRSGLKAERDGC